MIKPRIACALADTVSTLVGTAGGPAAAAGLDGVPGYLATREGTVQVAVFDNVTEPTTVYTEGPATQYTASIQKVDILAGWLRSLQDDDTAIPSGIPYSLQYLTTQMIEVSDNVAATSLFHFGGGCHAFRKFNTMIPMNDTRVACETPTYYGWGNTQTTAADQVRLMKVLAYGVAEHQAGKRNGRTRVGGSPAAPGEAPAPRRTSPRRTPL